MSITVLLADDNKPMRKAIAQLLLGAPDIEIVGEASDFAQTLQLVAKLNPRVVVLDVHMSDDASVSTEQLKSALIGSRTLTVSIWNDDETKSYANAIGAVDLLDKTNLAVELIPAIRCAAIKARNDPATA